MARIAGLDVDQERARRALKRFGATISMFAVFYWTLAVLVFRWDTYLGPAYARYQPLFFLDWQVVTTATIIFLIVVGSSGVRVRREVRIRTAVVVTFWDAIAAILVLTVVGLVIVLAYYGLGIRFPVRMDQLLFLLPVLSIAALSETLAFQWFLPRTLSVYWRHGYVFAAVMFATAHASLTIPVFIALVLLGLWFYYLTNPRGNLPFWVNVVFASGVHVIYNVFVLAYGGSQGLLVSQAVGFTGPTIALWVLIVALLATVVYGEVRSRLHKGSPALAA
jgi:hypothetical protein